MRSVIKIFTIFSIVSLSTLTASLIGSIELDSYQKQLLEEAILDEEIENQMNSMTLEQKIAQMLVIRYDASVVDEYLMNIVKNTPPGGIILFKQNITTYDATVKFVSDLQNNSGIPLMIGIDQEGGSVQRLQYLSDVKATDIPYMYYLGKTKNITLAYNVGKVMAEELKTIGVNVVFAPDIDIYLNKDNTVIGKRSFGEDYSIVSMMANSLAKGLEDSGVIATYKHFPGHGDTATDSHYALPIIYKTYEELETVELQPFKSAIQNGAKMIMIGHIALPEITNDTTPASLSKILITDILKNKLGYNGLIITDALNMKALTNHYSNEEIYVNAIESGVDLLLMPGDMEEAIQIIKNTISEDRINESVKKILKFKKQYLHNELLDKSYLGSEEHQSIISNITVLDE